MATRPAPDGPGERDAYDDRLASKTDECHAVLYMGESKPGVYGSGRGGATDLGEAVLIKYQW